MERELTETELDTVSGGLVVNAIIAILIPLLLPDPPKKGA
jgi:bacteriocin-like protein